MAVDKKDFTKLPIGTVVFDRAKNKEVIIDTQKGCVRTLGRQGALWYNRYGYLLLSCTGEDPPKSRTLYSDKDDSCHLDPDSVPDHVWQNTKARGRRSTKKRASVFENWQ